MGKSAALEKIQNLLKRAETKGPSFENAVVDEVARRTTAFVRGVRAYQAFEYQKDSVGGVPCEVIWRMGSVQLRDFGSKKAMAQPVLLVPSLINRYDILDFMKGHSFIAHLYGAGYRPLVIDWGEPGKEEEKFSIDDYIVKRLVPALDYIAGHVAPEPVHLMGYCMGGLLALAAGLLRPKNIKSLVLLATPWDFHADQSLAGHELRNAVATMAGQIDTIGHMPVDILQTMFALTQPFEALNKFIAFSGMGEGDEEAARFVRLEDWLNNGVRLTAPAAHQCFKDWYGDNKPALCNWKIGGVAIDPRTICCPTLVVVPMQDKIVPPRSALAMAHFIPNVARQQPIIGHIGMMVSHQAPKKVWEPITQWLRLQA